MVSPLTQPQRVIHFLNRTSFGPIPTDVQEVERLGIARYLDQHLDPETVPDTAVEEKISGLNTMRLSSRELLELYPPPRVAAQNGAMAAVDGPRRIILELQLARLLRAVYSRRQLHEIMVDFWTNHFNIFAGKGVDRWLTTSYDRDTIRPHALGRFRDLLLATAKSPAMLYYLDNWLSVSPNASGTAQSGSGLRQGLNENYARELMELHTLGVDGGYTEKDVREVARCFTGWTIRRPREQAEFQFNPRLHDDGAKVVLGTAIPAGGGIGDGLKVIDLLSRHPATAKLVASKLARRFVADEPPPGLVDRAAGAFRSSDGDLTTVLRTLVLSEEFFAPAAYRVKIKKPLEFVSSALRVTGSQTQITHGLLRYLARMGEPLFLAQAPNGYSDYGGAWVSPDMLLTRINFASDLVANKIPGSLVEEHTVTNTRALAALIAPDGLSSATQAALSKADGRGQAALLLAAPEFQRR